MPLIGIIILIIILTTVDFNQIKDIFLEINPIYSFLSFFLILPLVIIANIEWQILLKKQKIDVKFSYTVKNFFIGYFYGFISPGALGAYTRAIYLADESQDPLPKCFSNIVILNTIDYLALLILGAIGAIYLSSRFPYLFISILIVTAFILVLFFFFFFKREKSKAFFTRIIRSRVFSTLKHRLEGYIDSFYEDLPRFRDVLIPFSISILSWILKYIMIFYIATLFKIEIPMIDLILILAVSDVVASAPISIYGLGTRELSLLSLLSIFSVTKEQVVSLSLFLFVILWLFPSIIGAIVTIFETKRFEKIKKLQENI